MRLPSFFDLHTINACDLALHSEQRNSTISQQTQNLPLYLYMHVLITVLLSIHCIHVCEHSIRNSMSSQRITAQLVSILLVHNGEGQHHYDVIKRCAYWCLSMVLSYDGLLTQALAYIKGMWILIEGRRPPSPHHQVATSALFISHTTYIAAVHISTCIYKQYKLLERAYK